MLYQVAEQTRIAPQVFLLDLAGDTSSLRAPGQFVQLRCPGFFLRRPISVCDWDEGGMTLIFKAVGEGTKALSRVQPGDTLDVLCGLGNGYDLEDCGLRPLVIGGGLGVPPLYALTKALLKRELRPTVILGFNTKEEVFLREEFEDLGAETILTTADGSAGKKGFVTDALPADYDYFFACGPEPMLRAVAEKCPCPGQLSFEERMACGFGACMGCTHRTKTGYKRICKDGPVLKKEEVLW